MVGVAVTHQNFFGWVAIKDGKRQIQRPGEPAMEEDRVTNKGGDKILVFLDLPAKPGSKCRRSENLKFNNLEIRRVV